MDTLRNTLSSWLQQVGFVNGNPFATANADQESSLLPEYFVDTGHYNLVVGDPRAPQTTLIFAPRGCGKTAYRVMLEQQCYPHSDQLNTLVLPHVTFDRLYTDTYEGLRQQLHKHITSIIQVGLRALIQTLACDPDIAQRVNSLHGYRMRAQIEKYRPELVMPLEIWRTIQVANSTLASDWSHFAEIFSTGQFRSWSEEIGKPTILWWNHIVDPLTSSTPGASSPIGDFIEFVELVQSLGISSVYAVVDRLDELPETADSPSAVVDLILPLVAHLPLMETPGAAFKFFLPLTTFDLLNDNPKARLDRLPVRSITWSDDLLTEMLEKRLSAFSSGRIRSLSQLAREPLTDTLEHEMVQWANGSPRRLLRLGELLFMEQAQRAREKSLLLTREAWEAAYAAFSRDYPPPRVVVDVSVPQMWVGRRNIGLTPLEHRFLLTLYQSGGWSEKERLVFNVWDTTEGVSDQAVSRLVRRIREKIEPFPGSPIYLLTEHNQGFRLEHLGEVPER
jgi:hypothetical protein